MSNHCDRWSVDVAVVPTGGAVVASDRETGDVTVDLLTQTYRDHYSSLLKLAALLLDDLASCEDVVQEAFIRVHSARSRVRDSDKVLAYLRQTVVNLSRSALRRRLIGMRLAPKPMPDMASAEEGAYELLEKDALIQRPAGHPAAPARGAGAPLLLGPDRGAGRRAARDLDRVGQGLRVSRGSRPFGYGWRRSGECATRGRQSAAAAGRGIGAGHTFRRRTPGFGVAGRRLGRRPERRLGRDQRDPAGALPASCRRAGTRSGDTGVSAARGSCAAPTAARCSGGDSCLGVRGERGRDAGRRVALSTPGLHKPAAPPSAT